MRQTLAEVVERQTSGEVSVVLRGIQFALGNRNVYRGDGVLGKSIATACDTNFYGGDGNGTENGGTSFNLFDGGAGADTFNAPTGSINRYVFHRMEDSYFQTHDTVNGFDASTDVFDISEICRYEYQITCSGPYKTDAISQHPYGPGAIYYTWIPALNGSFTAVYADFTGAKSLDFYFPINAPGPNGDGKLTLTAHNFDFGN